MDESLPPKQMEYKTAGYVSWQDRKLEPRGLQPLRTPMLLWGGQPTSGKQHSGGPSTLANVLELTLVNTNLRGRQTEPVSRKWSLRSKHYGLLPQVSLHLNKCSRSDVRANLSLL